jgi:protein-S-isoprenylcysteine O-methyltransferase Ste14
VRWLQPLRRTPVQTFILMPLATIACELAFGSLRVAPIYLPLLAWGFLQYKLGGRYRITRGGGGPGLSTPPDRVVDTGLYAWTRNPMYLGHIIYMVGVSLLFQSWFGAAFAIARATWFHLRVLGDEKNLVARFGEPYVSYTQRVKRWLPGLF